MIRLVATAAMVVLAASCSRDNIEMGSRISLSANLTSQTRSIIASADAMKYDGAAFGVYGYKNFNNLDQLIFNNVKVYYSTDDWTYTPKKFWDRNAYYHYIAYWPYSDEDVSNDNSTHTLTISGIPNWQENGPDARDVMIAYSQMSAQNYLNTNGGEVRFTFDHMLSQIIIRAWYFGNEFKKPYIIGLTVGSDAKPVAKSDGTTDISRKYSDSTFDPSYSGPTLSGSKTLLTNASGDAVEQYFDTEEEGKASTLRTTMCTWLTVPYGDEAKKDIPIKIFYKLGQDGVEHSFESSVPLGFLTAGSTYVATLKFDTSGDVINLEAIIVKHWITGQEIDNEVYNW